MPNDSPMRQETWLVHGKARLLAVNKAVDENIAVEYGMILGTYMACDVDGCR